MQMPELQGDGILVGREGKDQNRWRRSGGDAWPEVDALPLTPADSYV